MVSYAILMGIMRAYLSSNEIGYASDKPSPETDPVQALKNLWVAEHHRIAVISSAVDFESAEVRAEHEDRQLGQLASYGFEPEAFDLRHYFGHPGAAKRIAQNYAGVYFTGGNTFNLLRAMYESGLNGAQIRELFNDETGIIYAAYSAGGCQLGHDMHGVALVDPPHDIPHGYPSYVPTTGLGVMDELLIPHFALPEQANTVRYQQENGHPYIPLLDGEALVINGVQRAIYSMTAEPRAVLVQG